ncbi:MAG: hypothetical protein H0W83_14710 [Planctomycetes bacterium]|nr:hypothetical protein [Planctomycetota bacterium]
MLGPGLVGAYLGAAGGATRVYAGPSGSITSRRAALPAGIREWQPQIGTRPLSTGMPLLVACRAHQTPWRDLPADCLVAQNGIGQPRSVMACFFALDLDNDGVVRAVGPPPRVVLADPGPDWTTILARWRESGITVELSADPRPAQWEKAILNATVGPLCLATGSGMAAVWNDPGQRSLVLRATTEGAAIASACGIAIPVGIEQRATDFFSQVGAHRPSVLRDRGELPWILGHLRNEAARHRIISEALDEIAHLVATRAVDSRDRRPHVVGGEG